MTEQEIRRELQAILAEAERTAELVGAILELLDSAQDGESPAERQAREDAERRERLERELQILDKRHTIPTGGYRVTWQKGRWGR